MTDWRPVEVYDETEQVAVSPAGVDDKLTSSHCAEPPVKLTVPVGVGSDP